MKIIICGAGEVGIHLAKMLSKNDHDIVLFDNSSRVLHNISSNFDVLTILGEATSINSLKEARVKEAELFIAVTPYEERNIIACHLARQLGADKAIARIDNQEFLLPKNHKYFSEMGINELIYPEHLAAIEIVSHIKQTGTRQIFEFSGGKIVLFGVKVRNNTELVGRTMHSFSPENDNFRAVAISRKSETIIPYGDDTICAGDIIFFVSKPSKVSTVLDLAGKKRFDIKNIMILGGSRIGVKTALRLSENFNVKIIEQSRDRSLSVAEKVPKSLVIHGDGRNLDLLKAEGIGQIDAFIAVTGNSETNILSCQLAKKMGVKRTVAEVENIDYIDLAETIGIGGVINKKLLAASYIYRYTMGPEVLHVKCLTATDAEALEFIANKNSIITRKPIAEIDFPKEATVGGIIRGRQGFIASGRTQVQKDDRVVVFTRPTALTKLSKFFK